MKIWLTSWVVFVCHLCRQLSFPIRPLICYCMYLMIYLQTMLFTLWDSVSSRESIDMLFHRGKCLKLPHPSQKMPCMWLIISCLIQQLMNLSGILIITLTTMLSFSGRSTLLTLAIFLTISSASSFLPCVYNHLGLSGSMLKCKKINLVLKI